VGLEALEEGVKRALAWARAHWLLLAVLALPGGLLLAALLRKRQPDAINAEPLGPGSYKSQLTSMIDAALEQAQQLTTRLKDQPLAAQLLGLSADSLNQASGADLAAKKAEDEAKAADLTAQRKSILDEIANRYDDIRKESGWSSTTPERLNSLQAAISVLQAKLAQLGLS
jgi:hypothetical protein